MIASRLWSNAAEAILGMRVRPLAPPGRAVIVPEPDPAGPADSDELDGAATWSAWISYSDAKGAVSKRVVTIRSIVAEAGEPVAIRAFCESRQALRGFRLDRIDEMACVMTGELIDPIENCRALQRLGALKVQDKALPLVMKIAVFMARCDNEFHALEGHAIQNVLERYARFFGGDESDIERAATEVQRLAPCDKDVIDALKKIEAMDMARELARFTIQACGEIIDADGVIRSEEARWGQAISDLLKAIASGGR